MKDPDSINEGESFNLDNDEIPGLIDREENPDDLYFIESSYWFDAEQQECCKSFPSSVLKVLTTETLYANLCVFCNAGCNYRFNSKGELITAFCASCLFRLANTSIMACMCGLPRFLDTLAKPVPLLSRVMLKSVRNGAITRNRNFDANVLRTMHN